MEPQIAIDLFMRRTERLRATEQSSRCRVTTDIVMNSAKVFFSRVWTRSDNSVKRSDEANSIELSATKFLNMTQVSQHTQA